MGKNNKYSKKELKEFKEKILVKKKEVLKDIMNSQDIADNMLENSNTSGVIYSSHLADGGADQATLSRALPKTQVNGARRRSNPSGRSANSLAAENPPPQRRPRSLPGTR